MKAVNKKAPLKQKDFAGISLLTILILMIPFIAMRFTKEVDWQLSDFIVMGSMIMGTGLGIVYVARKITDANVRLAVIVALVFTFLLAWAELAVGVFGTPFAGS